MLWDLNERRVGGQQPHIHACVRETSPSVRMLSFHQIPRPIRLHQGVWNPISLRLGVYGKEKPGRLGVGGGDTLMEG